MSLSVKHLLGIKDLAKEDIQTIFSTADNLIGFERSLYFFHKFYINSAHF